MTVQLLNLDCSERVERWGKLKLRLSCCILQYQEFLNQCAIHSSSCPASACMCVCLLHSHEQRDRNARLNLALRGKKKVGWTCSSWSCGLVCVWEGCERGVLGQWFESPEASVSDEWRRTNGCQADRLLLPLLPVSQQGREECNYAVRQTHSESAFALYALDWMSHPRRQGATLEGCRAAASGVQRLKRHGDHGGRERFQTPELLGETLGPQVGRWQNWRGQQTWWISHQAGVGLGAADFHQPERQDRQSLRGEHPSPELLSWWSSEGARWKVSRWGFKPLRWRKKSRDNNSCN